MEGWSGWEDGQGGRMVVWGRMVRWLGWEDGSVGEDGQMVRVGGW